jgi:flagellar motor component MotA
MTSTNSGKHLLRILGRIVFLALVALGVMQLGQPANFVDPSGCLFVLVSGITLVMVSFPGAEIRRALRDAVAVTGDEADIQGSAFFWEAAGRGFWILGVLCSILHLEFGFVALATNPGGLEMITNTMAQSLLAALYGILLAVICFIPCWKLTGILRSRPMPSTTEQKPISIKPLERRFGAAFGYVLFISVLASFVMANVLKLSLPGLLWMGYRPAMLVILGGTIALILFMRLASSVSMLSTAFAAMGLIGSLMGCIQMLHSMTMNGPTGIAHLAGALAFVLSSCFTALMGMVLVGAPLEDHAIRMGRVSAPSALSRVSWYVFPLLAMIFTVLVFVMLITPLTPGPH